MAFVLIGFMGAGKSTVAAELADALGVTPLDSDALLESRLGHPLAREFELHGEPAFRAKEEQLICELLAQAGPQDVIALGGGAVGSGRVRDALASHLTVLLDVDPLIAWERVHASQDGTERPLARDREEFLALHSRRLATYRELADAFLPDLPQGGAPRTLGALRALSAAPEGTRLLWARSASGDYPVLIGRGLLGAGDPDESWPLDRSLSRSFCVSDETVCGLYADRLGELAATIAISPGEASKTLASAERVWHALAAAGMTRADHVVALGGGVVGDLAGFCAATYQRGVAIVHVPTTLVAQVDSAYGGKTGVDLPEAKNYVGAYHQPAGVLVDPDTLATLPAAELAAGWVEVLKTALIAGGSLWEAVAARRGGDGGGDPRVRTDEARARPRGRARRRSPPAAEPRAYGRPRDRDRDRLLPLPPRRGCRPRVARGSAPLRQGRSCARSCARCCVDRGLPVTLDGACVDDVIAATARDKKRVGETCRWCCWRRRAR